MDQFPQYMQPLNCRPITLERAVIVKRTQKNLCRNYAVCTWLSVNITIIFFPDKEPIVTYKHAIHRFISAGSFLIVAMKIKGLLIFNWCCILLVYSVLCFSLPHSAFCSAVKYCARTKANKNKGTLQAIMQGKIFKKHMNFRKETSWWRKAS